MLLDVFAVCAHSRAIIDLALTYGPSCTRIEDVVCCRGASTPGGTGVGVSETKAIASLVPTGNRGAGDHRGAQLGVAECASRAGGDRACAIRESCSGDDAKLRVCDARQCVDDSDAGLPDEGGVDAREQKRARCVAPDASSPGGRDPLHDCYARASNPDEFAITAAERARGVLAKLLVYMRARLTTLHRVCVICDRPHIGIGIVAMLKPCVCSRDLCTWSFYELGEFACDLNVCCVHVNVAACSRHRVCCCCCACVVRLTGGFYKLEPQA